MAFRKDFFKEKYSELLQSYILKQDEWYLAVTASLGHAARWSDIPLDEIITIHHEAVFQLLQAFPDLSLSENATPLSRLLFELLAACGSTFRTHPQQRRTLQEMKPRPDMLGGMDREASETAREICDLLNVVLSKATVLHKKLEAFSPQTQSQCEGFWKQLNDISAAAERGKEIMDIILLAFALPRDPLNDRKLQ